MNNNQVTALMQYIDKSLDQRMKPIQDSIAGLCEDVKRIFSRLDEFSCLIVSLQKDIEFAKSEVERNEKALKECQGNCKDKMTAMENSKDASTRDKIEMWIYRACLGITAGALGYFIKYFLDDIAR